MGGQAMFVLDVHPIVDNAVPRAMKRILDSVSRPVHHTTLVWERALECNLGVAVAPPTPPPPREPDLGSEPARPGDVPHWGTPPGSLRCHVRIRCASSARGKFKFKLCWPDLLWIDRTSVLQLQEVAKARGRAHQLISLLDDDRLWRLSRLALSGGVLENVAAQPAPLPLGAPGAAPVHDAAAHGAAALPPGPALAGHYPAGQQAPARPLPPGLLSPSPVAHGPVAHVPVAETSAQPAVGLAPEAVSSEEKQLAVRQGTLAPGPDTNDSAAPPCTTLIVRNLSVSFADQEAARTWFDCLGFEGQYDFFLFFPGKTRRRTPESEPPDPPPSLGYFFVNFVSPSFAQNCGCRATA
ncbi:unnamed protein product [Prorocentrum cordatum]|uniref:Mei2-like C-terminal RNA recognition motif domain-containing protein n=1 Tax=Prorocentrum cordatum TaxID=2364126 RepID=A0ABN9VMC3_9DINO|nr:unnamed protein product [Polarella glacialis]